MKVDLFIPCFIDQLYPETAFNTVKVLEKLGVEVHYEPAQTCCGQMAFNSGYWDQAKELGKKFIGHFSSGRTIVSPSASCVGMVRNYYSDLFNNSTLHNECKQIQQNIFELSDYLVNVLQIEDIGAEFPHTVTFHDSCSALREYGIKAEPRKLLKKVKGLTLIEMNESEECCGFGGTFAVKYEAISAAMAEQKIDNALETKAEYLVSTECSCLMNLEGYSAKHKHPIKTIHLADILASGW